MITAIKRNKDGSLQKGSERQFSEHHWARMRFMFGDKLHWEQIKESPTPKKLKKKADKIVEEVLDTVKEITDDYKEKQEIKEEPKE
jgi:hypothetical protein